MSDRDNGGPAFPRQAQQLSNGEMIWEQDGMSLRQWYAGQALAGLVRDRDALRVLNGAPDFPLERNLAEACFGMADAMIAHEEGDK